MRRVVGGVMRRVDGGVQCGNYLRALFYSFNSPF